MELMTGLDPQASYDLKTNDAPTCDRGKMLFSTHRLRSSRTTLYKIAILKREFIFYGTIEELKDNIQNKVLESIYLSLAAEGLVMAIMRPKIIQQLVNVNIIYASQPVRPRKITCQILKTGRQTQCCP